MLDIKELRKAPGTELRTYQGTQGINDFMELVLSAGKPIHLMGAHFRFKEVYPELWYVWQRTRSNRKIPFKAIAAKGVVIDSSEEGKYMEVQSSKIETSPNVTWIFGEYVANVVWLDRETTSVFVIKNKSVAKQHLSYFNLLWKK